MSNPENITTAHEFIPKTPELPPELLATYNEKEQGVRYPVVCGDDRCQTAASQHWLRESGIEQSDSQIRYFGGAAGLERVLSVTLIASGKKDLLQELGATSPEAIAKAVQDIERTNNVTLELHSAESSEGQADHFNAESTEGVGCAYAASEATVCSICASDEAHRQLTLQEEQELFGTAPFVDAIREANREYKEVRFKGSALGLSRQDYKTIGAPVQILAGSHAPASQTAVAINFSPSLVSNPAKAHEAATPFYSNDVTQVAELLMRAYPQFGLDPKMLLAVMDQDIRAARAALAHGSPAGAAALKIYRIGTPAEAVAYLKAL